MGEQHVRAAFAEQAIWCERLGSPFTARMCLTLGDRLDRSTSIGTRVLDWPGNPSPAADNVPARLCACLHHLVRSGAAPRLRRFYPPAELPREDGLWAEILPLLDTEASVFDSWLDNPPQTNEVARSAVLMSGLLWIASRTGLPLHLLELGSSAGLNLILDRYGYSLGDTRAGMTSSPVQLRPNWSGPSPPSAEVNILSRSGVDRRPVDPRTDGDRLLAFVWADQLQRLQRLENALEIANLDPPPVAQGDAADWLEQQLPLVPTEGSARVIMHSIAFQYFVSETQRRIARLIEEMGSAAQAGSPLAWLRYEQQEGEQQASLRVRLWPDGQDRLLAWAHPHGASVEWLQTA